METLIFAMWPRCNNRSTVLRRAGSARQPDGVQSTPYPVNEQRVREVIAHYESQTEDEQFAEIEAAHEAEQVTLMAVPTELEPEVRALLAHRLSA